MYARAIPTSGCLFALQHRILRRRLSAALEHARTGFLVGRSDGVEAQRYAPLVSEVEDVGEPIASRQAQAVEPGARTLLAWRGAERRDQRLFLEQERLGRTRFPVRGQNRLPSQNA